MKRHILYAAIILFLLSFLFTACGGKDGKKEENPFWQGIAPGMEDLTVITERTEYYDITVEPEDLFALGLEDKMPTKYQNAKSVAAQGGTAVIPVGTQFFQGEPIQLWAEAGREGSDLYLYRKDGSRELLLENFSNEYTVSRKDCRWYMDQEGNFYCYGVVLRYPEGAYTEIDGFRIQLSVNEGFLVKILSSGEILYETFIGENNYIKGLCQMEDGRVYLLLDDRTEDTYGNWQLAELNPATGEPVQESVTELPLKYEIHLGKTDDFPAVTGYNLSTDRNISRVDMAEKSLSPILFFTGISYGWHDDLVLQDFQVLEDGGIDLLWTGSDGTGGLLEKLKMEKVEKIPIVVRGLFNDNRWFANKVAQFNMENSTYHVVVEDCGSGNDKEDFARLTSVQIGAGRGPDIINGSLMREYMEGLLEKGALEDLAPYMEASGIREEEYFPLTFASLRQEGRIYGVNPIMFVRDYEMAEEVLGDRETPDIETLADALLAREGEGIYSKGDDSSAVLKLFLEGSESLWGMVDWKNGSCNFNTPLFGKLLEAAKRYGDDGRKNLDSITKLRGMWNVLNFEGQAQLEAKGKVAFGAIFDDGCYTVSEWGYALAINSNSLKKEGAWKFIRFLISEEAQSADNDPMSPPLHMKAFEAWLQEDLAQFARPGLENGKDVWIYNGKTITEEILAEFKQKIEEARPLPIRTAPILKIVIEEAGYYFNGSKSAEDVSGVINKRVQLYLDERK